MIIIALVLIAILAIAYILIKKIFGCPHCHKLGNQKNLGIAAADEYPLMECGKCGNTYFGYD